ncbi:60S ribosomal protein L18 [Gregarina niphandrodes]|uniref:60S ribosomal protein L18 n=1 Tax=Gregarina niphandrodes TaxID=110365 RepID=A0A023BDH8_GRENI|nr:60S ribosomal protein L18 [Gregarina niphandrodes]EZG88608.1 60S ribosomal protein L18 [Gregarina niphandrodes]|eukprot:XP_011128543.1 60S ribosomal protein L18 [Gregarina niphandrodes]
MTDGGMKERRGGEGGVGCVTGKRCLSRCLEPAAFARRKTRREFFRHKFDASVVGTKRAAIDIPARQLRAAKKHQRKECQSPSPIRKNLVTLYEFLARRTDSAFNAKVAHLLIRTNSVLAPMSVAKMAEHLKSKEDKIGCVVGTITNDLRVESIPKMTICALRFSEAARARIEAAGGECLTFDQLAIRCPTGENCLILRGPTGNRKARKYFGNPAGNPKSHTRPRANPKYSH